MAYTIPPHHHSPTRKAGRHYCTGTTWPKLPLTDHACLASETLGRMQFVWHERGHRHGAVPTPCMTARLASRAPYDYGGLQALPGLCSSPTDDLCYTPLLPVTVTILALLTLPSHSCFRPSYMPSERGKTVHPQQTMMQAWPPYVTRPYPPHASEPASLAGHH